MNSIFIHYNDDQTVKTAAFRVNEKKVTLSVMEIFEIYQRMLAKGIKPIVMTHPDNGTEIHMLVF